MQRVRRCVACLVTSISLEHSDILGDTIEKVVKEKPPSEAGVPMLIATLEAQSPKRHAR